MKQLYAVSLACIALCFSLSSSAQVVISQVYGGGGNSGATYKNDFIELFNPTSTTVNLNGWSVQYTSSTGPSGSSPVWAVTNLSGSIAPGHYYLIQEAAGTGGTTNLPTPDATGTINMSGTSGKVALISSVTPLTVTNPSNVVDLVGFGSTANFYEGSGPTATLTNTTAALRINDGCTDKDNNATDFTTGAPNPRNSASPVNLCSIAPALTAAAAAGNNAAEPSTNGNFTITLSAPAPAGGVTVNYTLSGTAIAGTDYSNSSSGSILIPEGSSSGIVTINTSNDNVVEPQKNITITLTSATNGCTIGTSPTATITLTDDDVPPPANIVINEVYGGGGNSGATYKNDFIELYNNEDHAVDLAGWSVQYNSATGSGSWQVTLLSGTIPAHGFFLIKEAAGTGGTTNLPTPDVTGSIAMGATSGKVLLSNSVTAQTGSNPTTGVVDKIGYGTNATGYETAPTAAPDNTTSLRRVTDGVDNNNNAQDFAVSDPFPRNASYTTQAPIVVSYNPPNNSTDVPYNISTSLSFDKPVQKGSGSIRIYENGTLSKTINVNSADVSANKNTVTINDLFSGGKTYAILIDAGAFVDTYGNSFGGISDLSQWTFAIYNSSAPVTLPANFNFLNCIGNGLLPNGFTQFSQTGDAKWDCTPFGRDPNSATGSSANGVQINGYNGSSNIPNIDWLISPSIDLTGTTYPLLSFWSRTAFNGAPLQLKVSTDYTGGDPALATWVDLNGRFPKEASDVWTLSSNINLAAFKQSNVHFAFVYTSTNEDGARWTMDDISVVNSLTPPPPALTIATNDLQFNYVAKGSTADKTFTFIGNDLTGNVNVSSTGDFLLSKDGTNYSPSISYSADEANNISETVYIRFNPSLANQNFTGVATITTSGLSDSVNLKGSSVDPATTLEVVNWNMEWFGSTDPSLGPTNDDLQQQNAETVLKAANADIYGLVEVVDESRLATIVSHMPGYNYVICNYGSHVNPPESTGGPLSAAQKEAFVYKTSLFKNISVRPLINNQDINSISYNNWSSGRYPFLFTADVTLNCITKHINFVLIHAKANTSPTATAYARRKSAADELHDTLATYFGSENVIVLGDFNDDLDQSITSGFTTSSYSTFTADTANFYSPTLELSLEGKKSTASYNDMIDHVMLSNELRPYYIPGSATVLSDIAASIPKYSTNTSDHYPVFTRYIFPNTVAPIVTNCPSVGALCSTTDGNYTIPVFTATDDCDQVGYSYQITGATERSGNGNNASGAFNVGTSVINWTATDSWGNSVTCQTTVVVNETPAVSITDGYVLPHGALVNTVYVGYIPASVLSLTASASKGDSTYSYSWTAGNGIAIVAGTANQPTVKVYPTATGNYSAQLTLTVKDGKGCSVVTSFTVYVKDIRSGNNLDKVTVCHNGHDISISSSDVNDHLNHGDMLGSCNPGDGQITRLTVIASPNPSSSYFNLNIQSNNPKLLATVRIVDVFGRTIQEINNAPVNQIIKIGQDYSTGIYLIEVVQGQERISLKVIKY
jgi:hypothetical protein